MYDSEVQQGPVVRKTIRGDWEKWFAWRPVKIRGGKVWLRTIYRRCITSYIDTDMMQHYEHGTIFDVIKDESK